MKAVRGGCAAVLVAALAACDTADPAPKWVDPVFALAVSVSGVKAGDYAYTATSPTGDSMSGVVDVPSDSATLEHSIYYGDFRGRMTARMVGGDRYVKMAFDITETEASAYADEELLTAAHWWRVDPDRIIDGDSWGVDRGAPDVTGAAYLAERVVTAKGDRRTITGTVDVSEMSYALAFVDDITAVGPTAKALPFTVRLDERGWFTEWTLHAPAAGDVPAGDWTIKVGGYGAQEPQPRPPADQTGRMQSQGYALLENFI
jgi:hypothetical protein